MSDKSSRPAKLLVFSGAGLSADSGIATFRTDNGLWDNHNIDIVANGYTWRRNWDKVREFYNNMRVELENKQPNRMHQTIAKWQEKHNLVNITQNIDDLLERAGCTDVVHVHGFLKEMKCEACGHVWEIGYESRSETDRCASHKCNSIKGTRPNVVFFNEAAPKYSKMYKELADLQAQDCVVVIGTTGQVIDIESELKGKKCLKILNNLHVTPHIREEYFDYFVQGRAAEVADYIDTLVSAHMEKVSS